MAVRELSIPHGTADDDRATEMIRVWLAHENLHVSLLLGMWEDAEDSDVDERAAWGELLSDVIKHIANGLNDSHGWDKVDTATRIRDALLENLKNPDGVVTGEYVES
jgi:predicted secreted Zn-dependent protease